MKTVGPWARVTRAATQAGQEQEYTLGGFRGRGNVGDTYLPVGRRSSYPATHRSPQRLVLRFSASSNAPTEAITSSKAGAAAEDHAYHGGVVAAECLQHLPLASAGRCARVAAARLKS